MVNFGAFLVACQGNMVDDYVRTGCGGKAESDDSSSLHSSDKPRERQFRFMMKKNVGAVSRRMDRYVSRF